ncbi:septal ring lytic transglycosylase RlpA family protein [Flavobacterium sp. HXWNR69]|uniref:Probable endolytic peptidoglycan transglycosylase RlpA n=1 Tax=Flavobacterium fragile TaxID=2949085 RepID=A0ABT0TEE6_9FLAO|nr:septal ring lytic transglycosylase RlpA family protein [Flavobacterium sp. HXWNR69]MCL9769349.1 septal ring lytic transglycosylase RlpA family protein [Flavobacterium sp. HXWNR69]
MSKKTKIMRKNVLLITLMLLITALAGFSNESNLSFVRKASFYNSDKKKQSKNLDTIKKSDTLKVVDSLANIKTKFYKKNVEASHYSDKLNGRRTASGQVFSNKKYTAAHKTLKFGTKVKVTNIANNKSVIVTINDRGPYTRSREIDIAKRPFLDISHNKGKTPLRVILEIVEK